jgi:ribonuclease HII
MSTPVIVGIDEAGRGPLAGPVVAAAVHLSIDPPRSRRGGWIIKDRRTTLCRIFDSKQLEESERIEAYGWITANCSYGFSSVSAQEIDTIGILEATNKAMQAAVAMLAEKITPTYLLVDGRDAFWFDYPHSSIIRGDGIEPCIAAASIVAKVTRDRMMTEYAKDHPLYGFEGHKGYGAPLHIEAIQKHGPCNLHRKTYLRNILQEQRISLKAVSS